LAGAPFADFAPALACVAAFGFSDVAESLNACPDSADGRLGVLRQAVQDRQQAFGGPTRGQLCQFLLAGEAVEGRLHGGGGLFRGRKRHDFVRFVDRKSCHIRSPLATLCAAMTIHHSEALESTGFSKINLQGRRAGDEARRLRQIASGCVQK
jgi:hypothetical protein